MSGLQYKRDITDDHYGGIWMFFGVSFWTKKSELRSQPSYGHAVLHGAPLELREVNFGWTIPLNPMLFLNPPNC